jgi:hypothetical protein
MKFKTIEDALKVKRPSDKVVKILDNKFAIVRSMFENGTYHKKQIMFLENNTVYLFCSLDVVYDYIDEIQKWPNTSKTMWCLNHSENGKPYHYVSLTNDNRKFKHRARRLLKSLKNYEKRRIQQEAATA